MRRIVGYAKDDKVVTRERLETEQFLKIPDQGSAAHGNWWESQDQKEVAMENNGEGDESEGLST